MLSMFQEGDGNAGGDDTIISPPKLSQTSGSPLENVIWVFFKTLPERKLVWSQNKDIIWRNNGDSKQVINKHLSHEDDIDVGKDEQIVEIERKLSMRMKMLIKLKRPIWVIRMMMRNS